MGKKLKNLFGCRDAQKRYGIVFWVFACISILLIGTGFILPPTGSIDGSVLTACGELLVFPLLHIVYSALMKGTDVTLTHGQTSMTINSPDGDDETNAR